MGYEEPILNYWYRALSSPYGIEIVCSNVEATRAKLYALRKEVQDPDLDQVSIFQSPFDPSKLWLRKNRNAKT